MAAQKQNRCRKHRRDRRPRRSVAKAFAISKLAKSFYCKGLCIAVNEIKFHRFSDRRGRRSLQCLDQIRSFADRHNSPINPNLSIYPNCDENGVGARKNRVKEPRKNSKKLLQSGCFLFGVIQRPTYYQP